MPGVTITAAQSIEAGGFTPPGARSGSNDSLPAFCRVAATLKPSSDSDIKIEMWMPAASAEGSGGNWNGKWQAVGNGAFNGSIAYPAMMADRKSVV